MIIIGIDPGTVVTGYGIIVVEGNTYRALDYGCIRPPAKLDLFDRYVIIADGIEQLLVQHAPKELAVETQYMRHNIQSTMKLGMARVLAVVAARRKKIPVFEYGPMQAKRAVVGNGKASKQQVQGMVQRLLGLSEPPTPEDAADALALAICHAQHKEIRRS